MNEIIDWVKNVEVKYDDFLMRWKEDQKLLKDSHDWGTKLQDFYAKWWVLVESAQWDPWFPDEQKNVPYRWWSWNYDAWTCWDVTMVDPWFWTKSWIDYFLDTRNEFYKTSEVLEVLEKWKEALGRWNDPEEKQKMIDEYEKSL